MHRGLIRETNNFMFEHLPHSTGTDPGRRRQASAGSQGLQPKTSDPNFAIDCRLAEDVARARPMPLRAFDQIPMRSDDLARQGRRVAPLLAEQRVVFIGDMDGTASFLGLLAAAGGPAPATLLLLDFDERVLEAARSLAHRHGFDHLLETRLYNCFDRPPSDLVGEYDWFYVNPPYGSRNNGASAHLFITRGCELVRPRKGSGCLILPDDMTRPWTRQAMMATQKLLHVHGWTISAKADHLHQYHLDDDPDLSSSFIIVNRAEADVGRPMPFAGRAVGSNEIPNFYGFSTLPPYPRFISQNGTSVGAISAVRKGPKST